MTSAGDGPDGVDADPAGEQSSLASFSESRSRSVLPARTEELGAISASVADLETALDGEPFIADAEWSELSLKKQGALLCARLKRIEDTVSADADESDADGPQPRWYQ